MVYYFIQNPEFTTISTTNLHNTQSYQQCRPVLQQIIACWPRLVFFWSWAL